jgi:poly(A) polymerase
MQKVLACLDGEAGRTRIVGGIVRDTILDVPRARADIDMATELTPDEVIARAREAGITSYPTGIDHGTVTLRSGSLTTEVTTLREDVETDGRHAVVRFGIDWAADASRRDFTLNALYAGMDGCLFDPIGGLTDCINSRVRFIGEADRRIAEDGLRVYRFFRFTASHGREVFDPEGLEACARAVDRLDHLSAERVGSEMRRMLALPRVAAVVRKMTEIGLLKLPDEVVAGLRSYERQVANPTLAARMALILEAVDPDALQARWRLSNSDIAAASTLRAAAALVQDLKLHEAVYRYLTIANEALDVAAVRAGWGEAGKAAVREKLFAVNLRAFPISGTDLVELGMRPGRELGRELGRLERLWIDSEFALDRQALLSQVQIAG